MDKVQLQAKTASWVVDITLDGSDWQLYTSSDEAACHEAAKAINQGIKTLALMGCCKFDDYYKLMKPFANLGACDTEPLYVLEDVLVKLGIVEEDK